MIYEAFYIGGVFYDVFSTKERILRRINNS